MSEATIDSSPADIARFQCMARRGVIPNRAVQPLAEVFGAMRRAQAVIGPGHAPLEAIVEAVPRAYAENWLAARQRFAG